MAPSRRSIRFAVVKTAWGSFGFVARGDALIATFLPMPEQTCRRTILAAFPEAKEMADLLPGFARRLAAYYSGRRTDFTVKVDLSDVPDFRRAVLEACRKVPFGRTATYADLARAVGRPGATRAVGSAMSHNPLPLVIPCHRILRSDGSLGGFSSPRGAAEKQRMLRLESPRPMSTDRRRVGRARAAVTQRSARPARTMHDHG